MLTEQRFKLSERTLAIEVLDSERRAVSIPAGAIIRLVSGISAGDRTVEVLWEGRKVEIFACDMNMRGREIKDPSVTA
jgi:hypothetical protein